MKKYKREVETSSVIKLATNAGVAMTIFGDPVLSQKRNRPSLNFANNKLCINLSITTNIEITSEFLQHLHDITQNCSKLSGANIVVAISKNLHEEFTQFF